MIQTRAGRGKAVWKMGSALFYYWKPWHRQIKWAAQGHVYSGIYSEIKSKPPQFHVSAFTLDYHFTVKKTQTTQALPYPSSEINHSIHVTGKLRERRITGNKICQKLIWFERQVTNLGLTQEPTQKPLIPELPLSSLLILQSSALLLYHPTVYLLITPSLSADIPLDPRVELLETYSLNALE